MMVAARDLADHLGGAGLTLDDAGKPLDPLTVVDLDAGDPDEQAVAAAQATATQVLVGVASQIPAPEWRPLLRALDLTLVPRRDQPAEPWLVPMPDPIRASADLEASIAAAPRAAVAVRGLLRLTARLPVVDGLVAESAMYSMLLAGPEFARWRTAHPRRPVPCDDRPPVLVTRTGDLLEIRLNCAKRRNAFSRHMRDGLIEAFDLVIADVSINQVRLSGDGAAFCSGGDLDEFGTATDVSVAHLVRLDRSVAARIERCRERISVILHGSCIGAGIELPSFAGRVTARPNTVVQLPELRMGLIPGAGGTVGITRRIGQWRTAYLALSGEPIDAATALAWGLVDQIEGDGSADVG